MRVKPGDRFDQYSAEELRDIAGEIEVALTVPVNVEVEAEHRVYDLSEVREMLGGARMIVLQDCGCRADHGNCDSPLDTCLSLDGDAEEAVRAGRCNARGVRAEKAWGVLRRSGEGGS